VDVFKQVRNIEATSLGQTVAQGLEVQPAQAGFALGCPLRQLPGSGIGDSFPDLPKHSSKLFAHVSNKQERRREWHNPLLALPISLFHPHISSGGLHKWNREIGISKPPSRILRGKYLNGRRK